MGRSRAAGRAEARRSGGQRSCACAAAREGRGMVRKGGRVAASADDDSAGFDAHAIGEHEAAHPVSFRLDRRHLSLPPRHARLAAFRPHRLREAKAVEPALARTAERSGSDPLRVQPRPARREFRRLKPRKVCLPSVAVAWLAASSARPPSVATKKSPPSRTVGSMPSKRGAARRSATP